MGRPNLNIDTEQLYDMALSGGTQAEMAEEFGVSVPTLRKKIRALQAQQGILLEYRTLQSLQLTELQLKILDNITEEKIAEAPLDVLVRCYKILKDKEHLIEGKPTEVKGLVAYLMEIEKEEAQGEVIEATVEEWEDVEDLAPLKTNLSEPDPEDPNYMPGVG